jgi:hypothetical protein
MSKKGNYIVEDWGMMDQQYLWHQSKPQDPNGHVSSNHSVSNASKPANGRPLGTHGHAAGNGMEWGNEYGYVNGTQSSRGWNSLNENGFMLIKITRRDVCRVSWPSNAAAAHAAGSVPSRLAGIRCLRWIRSTHTVQ